MWPCMHSGSARGVSLGTDRRGPARIYLEVRSARPEGWGVRCGQVTGIRRGFVVCVTASLSVSLATRGVLPA